MTTPHSAFNPIFYIDFYKIGHVGQYHRGVRQVFSNWTPRSSHVPDASHIIHFGLNWFLKKYLLEEFDAHFFRRPWADIQREYESVIRATLHIDSPKVDHLEALHRHGRMPLTFYALPEGSRVPLNCPTLVVTNIQPEFFWLPNYLETLMSNVLWKSSTSATTAQRFRELFLSHAKRAGERDFGFIDWQGHDFSFRGMSGIEDACLSGMGHLTSFSGTDTIPAIMAAQRYYGADLSMAGSVNATEHSVMCAGLEAGEYETFERLLTEVYPTGIVSIVSDTWDLWRVLTQYIPRLRDHIVSRHGKVVIRPDCYDDQTSILTDSGWKLFPTLEEADLVAQVDDDGVMTFIRPVEYVDQPYTGDMIHFLDQKGKVDLLVTPNHRMVWEMTSTQGNVHTRIHEAKRSKVGNHQRRLVRSAPAMDDESRLSWFDRLQVAFQADGSFQSKHAKTVDAGAITGKVCLRFNFAKERKTDRLAWICEGGGFDYAVHDEPARQNQTTTYVWVNRDSIPSKDFGWVPAVADLRASWCREFIDELSHWDATRRSDTRFKFDTTSESVVGVVERVGLAAGYGVLISSASDERDESFSDVFTAHIMLDNRIGSQAITKTVERYDGRIYCVKVPTGKLVVKRNRATAVSGNSGDPVKIICGDPDAAHGNPAGYGVLRLLKQAVGTIPNPHGPLPLLNNMGTIYGDGINYDRADQILTRTINEAKLSPYNCVFGIGSWTYQMVTRDTYGWAMKATAYKDPSGTIVPLFKKPVTDNGGKFSHYGIPAVYESSEAGQSYVVKQHATEQDLRNCAFQTVFHDGELLIDPSFTEIRLRVRGA